MDNVRMETKSTYRDFGGKSIEYTENSRLRLNRRVLFLNISGGGKAYGNFDASGGRELKPISLGTSRHRFTALKCAACGISFIAGFGYDGNRDIS